MVWFRSGNPARAQKGVPWTNVPPWTAVATCSWSSHAGPFPFFAQSQKHVPTCKSLCEGGETAWLQRDTGILGNGNTLHFDCGGSVQILLNIREFTVKKNSMNVKYVQKPSLSMQDLTNSGESTLERNFLNDDLYAGELLVRAQNL